MDDDASLSNIIDGRTTLATIVVRYVKQVPRPTTLIVVDANFDSNFPYHVALY